MTRTLRMQSAAAAVLYRTLRYAASSEFVKASVYCSTLPVDYATSYSESPIDKYAKINKDTVI